MLLFCRRRDKTVWKSAWMTSAQIVEPTSSLAWADVIHADFQTVISRRLQNISTYLFCTAERMLRTVIMQNSRLIQACFPIKIDEVRIDRFCVRYDWWRRLQPTSSVSPVWYIWLCCAIPAGTCICHRVRLLGPQWRHLSIYREVQHLHSTMVFP